MGEGQKPDFKLCALRKSNGARSTVGAAWINEDGSISINLDPFIVLSGDEKLAISLFPTSSEYYKQKRIEKWKKNQENAQEQTQT